MLLPVYYGFCKRGFTFSSFALASTFFGLLHNLKTPLNDLPEVQSQSSQIKLQNTRPNLGTTCRIVIENAKNFHYETLEGVAMQYPVPWNELNCSTTAGPVIVDFVHRNWGFDAVELGGWLEYYGDQLSNRLRTRSDGVTIRFGNTIPTKYYATSDVAYHATIGASCTPSGDPKEFVRRSPNHYCVMHRLCEDKDGLDAGICDDLVRQKSCWVSPMSKGCYFLPSNLPTFETTKCGRYHKAELQGRVNICVSGRMRNHKEFARVLRTLQPRNVVVSLHQRDTNIDVYENNGVDDMVRLIRESDFVRFQRSISECDLMIPLIRPESKETVNYFPPPLGKGKLSGCITQAMGYNLPMVLHEDLYKIYRNDLDSTVMTYTSTESFQEVLSEMISKLKKEFPANKDIACRQPDLLLPQDNFDR